MSASHGAKTKARTSMKKAKRRGRRGRPSGVAARLGLRNMSLGQLSEVIEAARG